MSTLFRTGDGEVTDTIIVALELVNNDWFKRNLIGALELMCREENWTQVGTATVDFARDKANEMLENLEIDVIIPTLPIGMLAMFPIATIPAKWLLCNGSSKLRASYAELFAIIGTTYGSVDSTHFNVPDMRDKSPMGVGTSIVTTLGGLTGAATVALSSAQMPTHTHTVNDTGHAHTATEPGHNHQQHIGNNVNMRAFVAGGSGTLTPAGAATSSAADMNTGVTAIAITVQGATTGITNANTGLGQAHGNVHPVIGLNFMIYAGI